VVQTCPNPVLPDVDLPAYLGVWYEIGSTAQIKTRTEGSLACNTARYSLIQSGPIRVRNEGYNTSSGQYSTVVGVATVTGRTLRVAFPPGPSADYRIVYLKGDAKDRYHTAVVYSCDPGWFQALYILSRKPHLDSDESVDAILQYAKTQGITLEATNQFVLTDQDAITCGRYYDS
jgi:apolipoprotein D and lipocalin family protein